jgi:hypothetical protein
MYRLDLADERLFLPQPVYETVSADGSAQYAVGRETANAGQPAFYAMAPGRAPKEMAAVYAVKTNDGLRLTTKRADAGSKPLFFAPAATETVEEMKADLYEYVNKRTRARRYGIERPSGVDWIRADAPLCRVWRRTPVAAMADWQARPWTE